MEKLPPRAALLQEPLQTSQSVAVPTCSCGRDDDERKNIRMMKNRESALRSRARKRELEKEVRSLVDENLRLNRQCKQLKTEMAALIQPAAKSSLKKNLI